MKKNRIIIIGGTGFIGFHLSKFFLKKKWEVICVSRKKVKKLKFLKGVKYINADITKKNQLIQKLNNYKNIEYLINSGGEVDHKNKKKVLMSHYKGVKNLISIFKKSNLKKFVQIGSSLEYGKNNSPQCEKAKCKPISFYAKAKFLATKYLLDLDKNTIPVVIVRTYQVYGPHQDLNRFIPIIINGCLRNRRFPCSKGLQKRDFLFIDDFIRGIFNLMINNQTKGEIYNIGFGKPIQTKKIIFLIKNSIKKGIPDFGKIKMRKEENMTTYPSIKKIFGIIGWKPKITLKAGIIKTIKYYKKIK